MFYSKCKKKLERKNLDLLKHIVSTSSNENSIVIDFFCGSGTTFLAANELKRKWIGIDASSEAIKIAKEKLGEKNTSSFFENVNYEYENCILCEKPTKLLA